MKLVEVKSLKISCPDNSFLFYFLSPTHSTFVNLISSLSLLSHDTILSYLTHHFTIILSHPLSSFQNTDLFYDSSNDKRVSTCRREDDPCWPDQKQSESPPTHPEAPAPHPQ